MNLSSITITSKRIPDLSDVEQELLTHSYYYNTRYTQTDVSILSFGNDLIIIHKNVDIDKNVSYYAIRTSGPLDIVNYGLDFNVPRRQEYALTKALYHLGVDS